ncbi:hypothetical protein QR680_017123 [Steinernema hermaphroditum]|uniref:Fibronectin type-III domain-containing protein n=1 Tax=Steinernema hermaphroditum TaxID=289476 RepID=A0AA39HDE1_9BILA|nr:hypothetical protein QR680_017123 [Steinernema hermaphroditum]
MTSEHVTAAFLRCRLGEILRGRPATLAFRVTATNTSREDILFGLLLTNNAGFSVCPSLKLLLYRFVRDRNPRALYGLPSASGDGRRAMTSTVPPSIAAVTAGATSSVPEMHHQPPLQSHQTTVFQPPPAVYVAPSRPPPSAVHVVVKPPDSVSDCGSSSGLGGMAKNDGSSEPSSSANSELSTGAKQRPLALPVTQPYGSGAPAIAVSGPGQPGATRSFYTMTCDANGVPACSNASYFDQVTRLFPAGGQPPYVSVPAGFEGNATIHDLFLHIHSGETLSLMVGTELQMIAGPATIRMVGMAGLTPQALNISMPEGHVLQQVVDPDGVLRHMILSPQSSAPPTLTAPVQNGPGQQTVQTNGQPKPPAYSNHQTTFAASRGPSPSQSPPMLSTPPYPVVHNGGYEMIDLNNPYNARRYTMPQRKASEDKVLANGDEISASGTPISDNADDNETTRSSESEDNDKLKERLSSLSPPKLSFVSSREARLCWEGLDTSEASSSGGPFPHIDGSEFTYDISLFEVLGQSRICVSNFKLQSNGGNNQLTLRGLNPGREYCVTCRANLLERGLYGEPTAPLVFRTQSSVPDPPANLRLIHRGPTWFTLSWAPAIDNGLPIRTYTIHVLKGEADNAEISFDTHNEHVKVHSLEPATGYRVRIYASNSLGRGLPSQDFFVQTAVQGSLRNLAPPKVLTPPTPRSVRLAWTPNPEEVQAYWVEVLDFVRGTHTYRVCSSERPSHSSGSIVINDLQDNCEYRFRLAALTVHGEELRSEPVIARTGFANGNSHSAPASGPQRPPSAAHSYHGQDTPKPPLPSPFALRELMSRSGSARAGSLFTIAWKYSGPGAGSDIAFLLECAEVEADAWKLCYRGSATSHTIGETSPGWNALFFRVAACRRNARSPWSELLKLQPRAPSEPPVVEVPAPSSTSSSAPTELPKKILPLCSVPSIKEVSWNQMTILWACDNADRVVSSEGSTLIFELQRIDSQPIIIYSGVETRFVIEKLKPVEHVQLRVRGVLVDNDGIRLEGGWSPIGSACSLPYSPTPPQNLRVVELESSGCEETTNNSATDGSDASEEGAASGRHFVLEWSAPLKNNGSPVNEYRIFWKDVDSAHDFAMLGSSAETYFPLDHVRAGSSVLFAVAAMNEGGISESSASVEYTAPAKAPSAPRDFHVEAVGIDSVSIGWTIPESNGAAITGYRLQVYCMTSSSNGSTPEEGERNGKRRVGAKGSASAAVAPKPQLVTKRRLFNHQLVTSEETPSRVVATIDSLLAATEYRVVVCAVNVVGKGKGGSFDLETEALPPEPPMLTLLAASSNQLKLKWTATKGVEADSPSHAAALYYFVERENEAGSFSTVYEGDYRTCKVRNLAELSLYRFRIRAARNRRSAPGPWSSVVEFQTTRSPPPPVRGSPSVSEVSEGLFQIDWQPVRCAGEDSDIFYRLQCAPKLLSERHETWKTVYEGLSTSYSFRLPSTSAPYQARVLVVRVHDGEESTSLSSPVQVFSRTPSGTPRKKPAAPTEVPKPAEEMAQPEGGDAKLLSPSKSKFVGRRSRFGWFYRLFGDKHMAIAWSVLVVILTFSLANLFLL